MINDKLKQNFSKVISRDIPDIVRGDSNNFRIATILVYNANNNTADIRFRNNNTVVQGVPVSKGINSIFPNDVALILATDPRSSDGLFVISIFGSNMSNDNSQYQSIIRQDATSNSFSSNNIEICGWNWLDSNKSSGTLTKAITFGVTFTEIPLVYISVAGIHVGGSPGDNPTSFSDFDSASSQNTGTQDVTTTNFNASVQDTASGSCLWNFGFTWRAIGRIS